MLARPEAATAAEIAASIQKSKALVEAEAEHARARALLDEQTKKLNALIARNGDHTLDAEVTAAVSALDALSPARHASRQKLAPLRAEHGEAVARALDQVRADAATRLAYAIEAAREAVAVIHQSQVLIERAGGERPRLPPLGSAFEHLEQYARRLGGRTER